MEHTLDCTVKLESKLIKAPFTHHRARLSATGTATLGKDLGCSEVRGVQMFMAVLSSRGKIRWSEAEKKLI